MNLQQLRQSFHARPPPRLPGPGEAKYITLEVERRNIALSHDMLRILSEAIERAGWPAGTTISRKGARTISLRHNGTARIQPTFEADVHATADAQQGEMWKVDVPYLYPYSRDIGQHVCLVVEHPGDRDEIAEAFRQLAVVYGGLPRCARVATRERDISTGEGPYAAFAVYFDVQRTNGEWVCWSNHSVQLHTNMGLTRQFHELSMPKRRT